MPVTKIKSITTIHQNSSLMRVIVSLYDCILTLNETELLVTSTKIMRFSEKEALAYLKSKNQDISKATYYRILGNVSSQTRQRLYNIAKNLRDLHMERIDELEKIKKEMWRNYHTESKPYLRVKILKEIKELQPYISAYHESTQSILEETVKQFGTEEDRALSTAIS